MKEKIHIVSLLQIMVNKHMSLFVSQSQKKYCPNVLIKKDEDDTAYIGQYPKNTNFNHDWSFLQPSIQLTEDSFLRKIEIKFDSKARTEADRARLDFLEDILKTIVE